MFSSVLKLMKVINDEIKIYEEIAGIEEKKSDSILSRNVRELEGFIRAEEELLARISRLESDREKAISEYAKENPSGGDPARISLKDIASGLTSSDAHNIINIGDMLKKTIYRVKSMKENNEQLLQDNIDFFNLFISGLRETMSLNVGYNKDGFKDSFVGSPILFNRSV